MRLLKRTVSVVLSLIMIVSLFTIVPFTANAADAVEYLYRTWDARQNKVVDHTATCTNYTTITSTSSPLTLTSGWYVVNGDANITDHRVTISGKVYLILLNGTMNCEFGIRLSKGNSLFVYPGKNSSGALDARTGSDEEANIGGDEGENCGEFEFHGGNLKAYNNDWCSGGTAIGGGGDGGNCGALSFYGGTVDVKNNGRAAAQRSYGAVIGCGNDADSTGSDCYINIYGGTIKANNATDTTAACIGGGEDSKCAPINIYGGKITARSYNGAAIGSGQDGTANTITIKNAVIDAESGYGAAIGSGEDSDAKAITIDNSNVKAVTELSMGQRPSEGAAIGGGNCGKSTSIKISKSVITASARGYGAGIGGGDESDGGDIEITDSNVFAHSAQGGAGIGGGDEKGCGTITLKNSFVCAITDSEVNTAGEKFLRNYGDSYNTIMNAISSPATPAEAGWYAGGYLTAMVIAYLIEGTHTGAAIGSGDSGRVDKIIIDNCTVTAIAGDCGAGIGGGDEGSFGEINIWKSNIYSHGGDYGAGIGTGDEAETCGKIYIQDSNIEADSASEGAGIGTGNEVDETPTIEISRSTVTSRGGKYAAGIGGGDATGGGYIKIYGGSDVTATGGKDAAGIGGGEGGDGGTITINDSNVSATGSSCGAGIGNGEDGYYSYVSIYGSSRVEAFGGNSDTSAIGHGDNGIFYNYSLKTYIDDGLKVKAGSSKDSTSLNYGNARYNAVRSNRYALVYYCEHEHTEWWGQDSGSHVLHCSDCGKWLTSRERHTWNSDDICTVCGSKRIRLSLIIIEKDKNGQEVRTEKAIDGYSSFTLPECENVPDGYGFLYWKVDNPGSSTYYYPPGERLTSTWANPVVEAVYLPLKETKYIDKNGSEKTVMAKQVSALDNMEFLLLVTDGWYVIDRDLDIIGTTRCYGDVKFIVEDGCTWSAERYESSFRKKDFLTDYHRGHSTFSLYGQKNQTGYIDGGYFRGVTLSSFSQYGAKFHCYTAIFNESCRFFGGSFNSFDITGTDKGELLVDGGNHYFAWLSGGSAYAQIGWTKPTDSITLTRLDGETPIKIKDGQAFKDKNGNIYKGEITLEQQAALSVGYNDKTLTPYLEHNYGEPQWEWMNDYKDASALFKCIDDDCDDEQLVDAKVTYEDNGNIRTSTATCELNGETYTTTHSGRIRWNVNVGNCTHGTVTVDESTAKAGEVIKLSVTPDEGYVLKSWSVTPDDDSQSVETEDLQFTMPESDVTVSAEFIKPVDRVDPYIDENGEYHLGTVEHFELNGKNYAVNEDGSIGEELDSIDLSYFDFVLEGNTYRIKYYTGPYDNLTELVIPKTLGGTPITSLGTDNDDRFMRGDGEKPQFSLVLNENITEIKKYSFYTQDVKEVKGNTSGLKTIGDYAFSWGNSPDNFNIDVKLDYEGTITCGSYVFNHRNATLRLKHSTKLSKVTLIGLGAQSVNYIFTDAHNYGEPEWKWADDYSSAKATFTCTDSRCKHTEKVDATVTKTDELTKTTYTASAELDGVTHTATKTVNKNQSEITVESTTNGTVTADKSRAYEGEEVTLTITPDTGYKLSTLTVKDENSSDVEVSNNKFVMPDSAVTVTATFEAKSYDITYEETDSGWVKGAYSANYDDEIELNITPASGYEIDTLTVTDDNENVIPVTDNKFSMPDSDVTVSVTFKKSDLNITYGPFEHGTITGAVTAQFNDHVPLTIIPDEGYAAMNVYAEDDEWGELAYIIDNELYMLDGDVTVYAEFVPVTPAQEPYIDENGEYHLGNIEHCEIDGYYFAVENGIVGSSLDSVEVSYFDFTDNGDSYQINYYSGPTENLTELVIPKTFKGKPITVLGTDNRSAFVPNSNPKPQFTLTLNENIREIKGYAFYTMWLKKVQGDTSNLRTIGNYAFSWANSPDDYALDIKLDYEGTINVGREIFNHMNVTARIKHATSFSKGSFSQRSINYIFTDAHSYGEPEWIWSDDLSSATAEFTCSDNRCKHSETVDATVTSAIENDRAVARAAAEFDGVTYSDTKSFDKLNLVYNYNVYNEASGNSVSKSVTKQADANGYTLSQLVGLKQPHIQSAYYKYGTPSYTLEDNTLNVTIPNTDKKYTVTLDGNKIGEYDYLQTATINLDEEKSFIVDGKVVYVGKSYSFYVGSDIDIITDEPTEKTEYAYINLNNVSVTDEKVELDMLATANVNGKFERMGVAFALSEKTEDEIAAAVQDVKTGTGTSNKIAVHNSTVDWYNQSGQYQFRYAPYFARNKAKDRTIYFYTYVVDNNGNVKVSDAAQYNMRNLLA